LKLNSLFKYRYFSTAANQGSISVAHFVVSSVIGQDTHTK